MSAPDRHPRTLTRQLAIAGIVFGLIEVVVFAAVQSVSDIEKSVTDAEPGMRGFVIAGREQFPQPTNAVMFIPAADVSPCG
jgi:hypothetical protein